MTEEQAKVEKLLREAGFRFEIGGCGCCGSPWVKVEYKGEIILDESDVDMNMFKEKNDE